MVYDVDQLLARKISWRPLALKACKGNKKLNFFCSFFNKVKQFFNMLFLMFYTEFLNKILKTNLLNFLCKFYYIIKKQRSLASGKIDS